MRSIALAVLFVLFGIVQCFANPNEPTGYGGYTWGTRAEEVDGLDESFKPSDATISMGTRPADGRTFIVGEYSFTADREVLWMFLKNRFGGVMAIFTVENFPPVKDALFETFGKPNLVRRDDVLTYYYWTGTVGRVMVTIPHNRSKEGKVEIGVGYASYEYLLNKTGGSK
ncbi:MAG TPA: hypothetical protein VN521_04670 [Negativicutes bacterium]|nr:hypothetical protein [Negativicutes bacterium]